MTAVDYSLDIVGLAKSFRRQTLVRSGYTTIKSALVGGTFGWAKRLMRGLTQGALSPASPPHTVTNAIQNLTVRVPKGSSIGIIGRNGSGKSTLLKLITGIYKPDKGVVRVNGRVAALIELGAGFHPDFTGRENLLLGGVMHGLSRGELEARMDDIIEFAELQDVIDDPVRTYSSGMFMRLGFSLAVHTDPDILIIDEVLAVGDAAFTSKCKERIARLRREGKTLLLVSHDLDAVERWCDEVVWLDKGVVADRGNPRRVIDHYREFIERGEEQELQDTAREDQSVVAQSNGSLQPVGLETLEQAEEDLAQRWGSREVEIQEVSLSGAGGEQHLLFHPEDMLRVSISYVVRDAALVSLEDVVFGVGITRSDGVLVHGTNTEIDGVTCELSKSAGVMEYTIRRLGLLEGNYRLDVAVHRKDGYPFDYRQGVFTFAVRSSGKQVGVYLPERSWATRPIAKVAEFRASSTGSELGTAQRSRAASGVTSK